MSTIHRTVEALADFDEIWDEIAKDNLSAADRVIDRIKECCDLLESQPRMGQTCFGIAEDLPDDLRHFTALPYPYVIFYRATNEGIIVYRVLHGHRDIPEVFRRQFPAE